MAPTPARALPHRAERSVIYTCRIFFHSLSLVLQAGLWMVGKPEATGIKTGAPESINFRNRWQRCEAASERICERGMPVADEMFRGEAVNVYVR